MIKNRYLKLPNKPTAKWLILKNQSGVIIIGAFIITLFFLTVSIAVAEFGVNHYTNARRTLISLNALQAAEAGADRFMAELALSSNHQGTNNAPSTSTDSCVSTYTVTPVELANDTTQGKTTYESCVQNGSIPNEKIVYITGKVYIPATRATPNSTRKLRLVVGGSGLPPFSVQTANGGLVMSNSSTIAGDAYINGRLLMSNSTTIGSAAAPSEVWVAGMGCGSGSSYPQICPGNNSSDLSIYIANPQAHIYADVHSPNMTGGGSDGSSTRSRMTLNGLVDGVAPAIALPDDNRATVMARNTWTNVNSSTASCSSGTRTWAAGTHFTGNNTISISNSCRVTVLGDIWIDGALSMSNSNSRLITANGLPYEPNILIDGQNGFRGSNGSSLVASSDGKAFYVTTFWSQAGSCQTSAPSTCPTPTGANLLSSTNTTTIETSNTFTAPGVRFYAVWSGVRVNNSTTVGQLLGQKVELSNSGTITFGTASGGTPTEWKVKYYEQVYN